MSIAYTVPVTVTLPKWQVDALDRAAGSLDRTRSKTVSIAIGRFLEGFPSAVSGSLVSIQQPEPTRATIGGLSSSPANRFRADDPKEQSVTPGSGVGGGRNLAWDDTASATEPAGRVGVESVAEPIRSVAGITTDPEHFLRGNKMTDTPSILHQQHLAREQQRMAERHAAEREAQSRVLRQNSDHLRGIADRLTGRSDVGAPESKGPIPRKLPDNL